MPRKWDQYPDWKAKNKDVIAKFDDLMEKMKNKVIRETQTLNWWDGALFTAFETHTEKRMCQKILRSYLSEKDVRFLR